MVQVLHLSDLEINWNRQEDDKVAIPEEVGKKANTVCAQIVPKETELSWQRVLKDDIFQAFMHWDWKRLSTMQKNDAITISEHRAMIHLI